MVELIARYRQSEDLIMLGAYKQGMNTALDRAVSAQDAINAFLRQPVDLPADFMTSRQDLLALVKQTS